MKKVLLASLIALTASTSVFAAQTTLHEVATPDYEIVVLSETDDFTDKLSGCLLGIGNETAMLAHATVGNLKPYLAASTNNDLASGFKVKLSNNAIREYGNTESGGDPIHPLAPAELLSEFAVATKMVLRVVPANQFADTALINVTIDPSDTAEAVDVYGECVAKLVK